MTVEGRGWAVQVVARQCLQVNLRWLIVRALNAQRDALACLNTLSGNDVNSLVMFLASIPSSIR